MFGRIRDFFVRSLGGVSKATHHSQLAAMFRNYNELASIGGTNTDWALDSKSQDSDVWQNNFALRQRLRDLFDTTPFFRKYREQLCANVFGEEGIKLRMKVKETEDRIVYVNEEKSAIQLHMEKMERITEWVGRKLKKPITNSYLSHKFGRFDTRAIPGEERAKGMISVGALDIYANQIIERGWNEWKKAQFATVTGKLTYDETRHIRVISAARDGDHFIRLIRDPRVNKFGFSLQLINSEYCDFNFNCPDSRQLTQTDVPQDVLDERAAGPCSVRMGVELNQWGKPIAYHFIKRQPQDWQFAPPGGYFLQAGKDYVVISAKDIIHYARFDYADSTRPAAWGVASIPVARDLSKYVEAAVKAARAGACQMGFLESTMIPEGGGLDITMLQEACKKVNDMMTVPGMIKGLPYGVTFKPNHPDNPNSKFGDFRKEAFREMAAAVPGGNYNILANDAEGISYSTGRIFSLDDREMWKMLQRFDIDKAERPIFEAWLEMALMTGAIKLPFAKFEKFNRPVFSGRRWSWVDPAKDAKALETELANFVTSWTRIFDDRGEDLEEVWIERAEEMMLAEALGLELPTFNASPAPAKTEGEEEGEDEEGESPVAGKNGKKNGRHISLAVN